MTATSLNQFKISVESRTRFHADDFVWAYRCMKSNFARNPHQFCWFMSLRCNIYGDAFDFDENVQIKDAAALIKAAEIQAVNTYKLLSFGLENPGYYGGATDDNGNVKHGQPLIVKRGEVIDFRDRLLEMWPQMKLFDKKEELLEFLQALDT